MFQIKLGIFPTKPGTLLSALQSPHYTSPTSLNQWPVTANSTLKFKSLSFPFLLNCLCSCSHSGLFQWCSDRPPSFPHLSMVPDAFLNILTCESLAHNILRDSNGLTLAYKALNDYLVQSTSLAIWSVTVW